MSPAVSPSPQGQSPSPSGQSPSPSGVSPSPLDKSPSPSSSPLDQSPSPSPSPVGHSPNFTLLALYAQWSNRRGEGQSAPQLLTGKFLRTYREKREKGSKLRGKEGKGVKIEKK